jgi:hypothetical protein
VHQTGTCKQAGEQKNPRSHGKHQRYRSKVPLQRQNHPTHEINMYQRPERRRAFMKLAGILLKRATSVALTVNSFILRQVDSPPIFFTALATEKLKRRHG